MKKFFKMLIIGVILLTVAVIPSACNSTDTKNDKKNDWNNTQRNEQSDNYKKDWNNETNHTDEVDPSEDNKTNTMTFSYRLINNNQDYEIIGYTGDANVVTLPTNHPQDGKKITHINWSAFQNNDKITEIIFPEGLGFPITMDMAAFYNCSNLTKIDFKSSVQNIPERAFANCKKLAEVKGLYNVKTLGDSCFMGCSSLKDFKADTCYIIGSASFWNCSSLETVSLGVPFLKQSASKIGQGAFHACTNLKNINLAQTEEIGNNAFELCTALETIKIPQFTTKLGADVFSQCFNLKTITAGITEENTQDWDRNWLRGCDNVEVLWGRN